jgi:hypothetical protein
MDSVTLVSGWLLTVVGSAWMTVGLIELMTARSVLGLGHGPRGATSGEIRARGAVRASVGLGFAIWAGSLFLVGNYPEWWAHLLAVVFPLFMFATPASMVLLQQHHDRKWPFTARAATSST